MKRFFATLIGSGTVAALTVTASAWAGPGGLGIVGTDDPVKRAAAKTCIEEARVANPDGDKDVIREAAKPCLTAAGIEVREPTPEQKARRQAIGDCVKKAKAADPDGERPAIHEAVKACLAEAGITLPERPEGGGPGDRGPGGREPRELTPEQQAKRDAAKKCIDDARTTNPDADKEAVHEAARACLEAAGLPVPPAPTAEQKAARTQARECMKTAREANPGGTPETRQAIREAVKTCLDAAGIERGDLGRPGGPGGKHGPGGPGGHRIDPGEGGETEAAPASLQQ